MFRNAAAIDSKFRFAPRSPQRRFYYSPTPESAYFSKNIFVGGAQILNLCQSLGEEKAEKYTGKHLLKPGASPLRTPDRKSVV